MPWWQQAPGSEWWKERDTTLSWERDGVAHCSITLTHLVNIQADLVSHFQAPIDSSYVKHIAPPDLHVLHGELCFLNKMGESIDNREAVRQAQRMVIPTNILDGNWKDPRTVRPRNTGLSDSMSRSGTLWGLTGVVRVGKKN